ncbi:hypothetical protein OIU79_018681 [Salix purpurea]|uniref:Uncharacterized protein n=1 Tax=Salix purpurea TaxID=77065 RepID=A0A9Q1ALM4_SALPP|nr:hypothetical protein OIU79_018681 [Salix purpurea]
MLETLCKCSSMVWNKALFIISHRDPISHRFRSCSIWHHTQIQYLIEKPFAPSSLPFEQKSFIRPFSFNAALRFPSLQYPSIKYCTSHFLKLILCRTFCTRVPLPVLTPIEI